MAGGGAAQCGAELTCGGWQPPAEMPALGKKGSLPRGSRIPVPVPALLIQAILGQHLPMYQEGPGLTQPRVKVTERTQTSQ